jgi:hypothetical protein
VWYGLYGSQYPPSADAERFAWGLLIIMTTLALLFLIGIQRWAAREAGILEGLRRELTC